MCAMEPEPGVGVGGHGGRTQTPQTTPDWSSEKGTTWGGPAASEQLAAEHR